jgi:hypothetical protein
MEQSCSIDASCNFGGHIGKPSGAQVFLVLDTGHTIIRHQWVALPMPPAVIDCVNLLGQCEPAMLTFTNRHGRDIGDNNPQDTNSVGILDEELIIIHPAVEIPGVDMTTDPAETAEVDPDIYVKPTGVDMDTHAWAMDTDVPVDDNAIVVDGLKQQDPIEGAAMVPSAEPTTSPKKAKSQPRRLHPLRRGWQHKTLVQGKHLRSMSQA